MITRLPRDHGHLAAIEASYAYLRQFTPHVLAAVTFAGGPAAASLLAAVEVLRALNRSSGRAVPVDAPTDFVPTRWAGYLDAARAGGDTTGYRHYWELCVLLGLRYGLRSGTCPYTDPTARTAFGLGPAQVEILKCSCKYFARYTPPSRVKPIDTLLVWSS